MRLFKLKQQHLSTVLAAMLLLTSLILIGLFWFDYILQLDPCPLCLLQRPSWYFTLLLLSLIILLDRIKYTVAGLAIIACLCSISFLLASYHVGVEYQWWGEIANCANLWHNLTGWLKPDASLLASLPEYNPCTINPWRLFAISLAGYNAIFSLLMCLSAVLLLFNYWPANPVELSQSNGNTRIPPANSSFPR